MNGSTPQQVFASNMRTLPSFSYRMPPGVANVWAVAVRQETLPELGVRKDEHRSWRRNRITRCAGETGTDRIGQTSRNH